MTEERLEYMNCLATRLDKIAEEIEVAIKENKKIKKENYNSYLYSLKKEMVLKHNKTFGGCLNDHLTCKMFNLSEQTLRKYKKELLSTVY